MSPLKPRDSQTSTTPAIAFTLRIKNPTKQFVQVSFLVNLPLGIQPDTSRDVKPDKTFKNRNITQCSQACNLDQKCFSWKVETKSKICQLFYQVPLHEWKPGSISGQKVTWTAHDSMLTLNRCGNYPQSGNTTILTDEKTNSSFIVSNSFEEIWDQFEKYGYLVPSLKSSTSGFYGVAAVNVTVMPGKEEVLTMILGWFYPNRDFTGVLR